ncbi:MAG TPA: hypothetical protein VFQ39_08045 [Longimicrobium sp.]|nr:hypothetical protein [Longimicrobium sp.]
MRHTREDFLRPSVDPVAQGEYNDLAAVRVELEKIARATAALLLTHDYDEAELAELDVRARELRAALAAARPVRVEVRE